MRHVDPPPRPRGWQTDVLQKGRDWLNESPENRNAVRPASCWLDYRDEIGAAFRHICCYTAMYVPNGEADHFEPWADVRGTRRAYVAYEWGNIRYADGWINRSKGADRFPDPFVVQDDWFELELPSLELRSTDRVPAAHHTAVANLLRRVRNDERVMKVRRRYLEQYRNCDRSLRSLDQDAPLLGRALRRHPEYLLPADRVALDTAAP